MAHDWLAYILVTACGGIAIYDTEACLDYRQHGGNLIGANASLKDRVVRFRKMLSGRFVDWNDANLKVLNAMDPLLTQESRATVECFERVRRGGLLGRICALRRSGVYRQTTGGDISLAIAACLRRI
ncbi:hypothetical protein D3C77_565830 [compost metagenome]